MICIPFKQQKKLKTLNMNCSNFECQGLNCVLRADDRQNV